MFSRPGFFLKILMVVGGGLIIFRPSRSPTGTKSDGRNCEKNPTEAETVHLIQN